MSLPDSIQVRGLRLWAHVGVLEQERLLGQWFELDVELGADLGPAGRADDLSLSHDYVNAITRLQRLSGSLRCHTLEQFSERILAELEAAYGLIPMRLELRKCAPPIPGFTGTVAVRRQRRWG